MPNDLITMAEANVPAISSALESLWASLEKSAASNITTAAGTSLTQYTQIEQRAMLRTEMLNQTKGLDLASVLIKGRLVSEIRRDSLFSVHPHGYATLEELAVDQGISVSELSQIVDMTEIIFPWLEITLGLSVPQVWESLGKSNMRELVPVLKRIITGEVGRGSVEASAQRVMDDVRATAAATGETLTDEQMQHTAVRILLEAGQSLTNANLRQTLRPDRAPSINATLIAVNGAKVLVAELDDRQEQMIARRLHGYWDPTYATAGETNEALRRIARLLEGGAE